MISIVFENGHKRVYSEADLIVGNSIYKKLTDGNRTWLADVPANAIAEGVTADWVEGIESNGLEKALAIVNETRFSGGLKYAEANKLREMKRLLNEFDAKSRKWKGVAYE